MPLAAQVARQHRIAQQAVHRRGPSCHVFRVDDCPGVADDFRQGSARRNDGRYPDRQRLERRQAKSLVEGRHDQHRRLAIELFALAAAHVSDMSDVAEEGRASHLLEERLARGCDAPGEHELRSVRPTGKKRRVGFQHGGDVLSRLDGSHEQHVSTFCSMFYRAPRMARRSSRP